MIGDDLLASDPVFQLNTMLWSVMKQPSRESTTPVLAMAGYHFEAMDTNF